MDDKTRKIIMDILHVVFVIIPLFLYVLNHSWKACAITAAVAWSLLIIFDMIYTYRVKKK